MIGLGLTFSVIFLFGGLFSPAGVEAQPADKIARIGHLGGRGATPQTTRPFSKDCATSVTSRVAMW